MSVQYSVRDRNKDGYKPKTDRATFVKVEKRGVKFDVDGTTVELFPLKVIAEALDRKSVTLTELEKAGKFPKPIFRVEGKGNRRYYSAIQVVNCNNVLVHKWRGRKYFQQKGLVDEFFRDIFGVWYAEGVIPVK